MLGTPFQLPPPALEPYTPAKVPLTLVPFVPACALTQTPGYWVPFPPVLPLAEVVAVTPLGEVTTPPVPPVLSEALPDRAALPPVPPAAEIETPDQVRLDELPLPPSAVPLQSS